MVKKEGWFFASLPFFTVSLHISLIDYLKILTGAFAFTSRRNPL
jgi:hypothetical protein